MEGLQDRLKSKDELIERKNKECQASHAEKRRAELEVLELRDQLEVKVNRINSLQRKVRIVQSVLHNMKSMNKECRNACHFFIIVDKSYCQIIHH